MTATTRWHIPVLFALLLVLIFLFIPHPRARWLLNRAQLQRLHGTLDSAPYATALALAPNDEHIRWQAASLVAAQGNCAQAIQILNPLSTQPDLSRPIAELLLTCLLATNQTDQAVQFYSQLTSRPTLEPGSAAKLLAGIAVTPDVQATLSPEQLLRLVAHISQTNPHNAAYRAWSQATLTPDVWQRPFGQELRYALEWRSQSLPVYPVAPADAPDPAFIAQMLDIDPEAITLSPALLNNGQFGGYDVAHGRIPHWTTGFWNNGSDHNWGLFLMGIVPAPDLTDTHALRITLLDRNNDPAIPPTRAGFWYSTPITLTAQTPYVLSFWYRTQGLPDNAAALFLTEAHDVLFRNDLRLPASEGQWQRVTIIGWNQTDQAQTVRPLLRLWELGSVWFTNVSLHALQSSPPLPPQPTIIHIAPVP